MASSSYARGITMKPCQLRVLWSSEMNIIGVSRPGLPLPHWWPLRKSVHRNILFGWHSVFFVFNVIASIFKWLLLHKIWILNFSWRMGRSRHSGPAFKQGSKLLELSKWLPICLRLTTVPTSPYCLTLYHSHFYSRNSQVKVKTVSSRVLGNTHLLIYGIFWDKLFCT